VHHVQHVFWHIEPNVELNCRFTSDMLDTFIEISNLQIQMPPPATDHNTTILEAAGTHFSYLSTALDC